MADEDKYDFADWELSSQDEETLRNVVRGNLNALQEQIQAGQWCYRQWDENCVPLPPHKCEMQWKWGVNIEDPPLLVLRPAQLAAELIYEIKHIAKYGFDRPPGDKDELCDFWQRITAGWRAALDAVDEEARRLLDLHDAPHG